MKKSILTLSIFAVIVLFSSCVVIRPGQVGVKQKLGRLTNKVYDQGSVGFNPFITKVIVSNIQTQDLELSMALPSKEGLSIGAQISILYKLDKKMVISVINNIGLNYETIVSNVFRSSASDVCAQFYAKDMHSGMRNEIENKIKERMSEILNPQGILMQSVLMKSIQLPPGLAGSIEQRLQAEQDALRMEYLLQQTKLEADRKIIEAKGIRDAQIILSEGLNGQILQLKSIDAFLALAKSNNAKIIITDGKTPFIMNDNISTRDTVKLKR